MTVDFIKQIISLHRVSFIALAFLAIFNLGIYIYIHAYQEPSLAAQQNRWFEKRLLVHDGAMLDSAGIYQHGVADMAAWRARISPKKDFARFIGELFETAANNSLTIDTVGYKPTLVKGENLLSYSISCNLTGKYAAIKSFIADLGRLREMVTVDNIRLNNPRMTEESVDLNFQLTAYFRTDGQ